MWFFFQSLQDEDLKALGRDHTSLQALQTLDRARSLCPGRVSVDVMFGRPGQSVESWEKELSQLLRVCDEHVSLYQLTLERGTQLFRQVERGEAALPAEGATAEMYRRAREILHQRGFLQYEVSNFARNVSRRDASIHTSAPTQAHTHKDTHTRVMFDVVFCRRPSVITI